MTAAADAALQALAEPHRREILRLVSERPLSVNEVAEHFEISQQAVSQHLKVLREAELVAVTPAGQRRLYQVKSDGLESVQQFLAELWPASLRELKRVVETGDGG